MLTPGKLIEVDPSKDTPPMFTADCSALAVAELPVQLPDEPVTLPVTLPVMLATASEVGPLIAVQCTVPHFCADDPKL